MFSKYVKLSIILLFAVNHLTSYFVEMWEIDEYDLAFEDERLAFHYADETMNQGPVSSLYGGKRQFSK